MKKIIIPILFLAIACSSNRSDYNATGTFDATEVVVSSEVAGAIIELNVSEGAKLKKGEVVGLIDTLQLHLQKQQLLKNIQVVEVGRPSIGTQLAPLKEQLAKQQKEKKRVENLIKDNAASQKQLDDISSAILVLEKQISAQQNSLSNSLAGADAQVAALKSQVAQVDDKLSKCHISSPIDGVVVSKYVQAGELTSAGKPMMKIADMNNIYLKAYLISAQLSDVKLGQKVKVRADFGGKNTKEYDGEITWISDKSEFTPKNIVTSNDRANMVYATKIAIQNDGYIKIGMYGEVKF
ncbi:MAG: HlyD family efflux transporter periplasmic adaptor subunit [Prevotellaceae bacterium]|jgi:HlyD family secretion protein|nr:HlyD family efflux transporter periplasmic adaptor subunit [Prevotellaceae bacterium]